MYSNSPVYITRPTARLQYHRPVSRIWSTGPFLDLLQSFFDSSSPWLPHLSSNAYELVARKTDQGIRSI
jgi:hypothetical protein